MSDFNLYEYSPPRYNKKRPVSGRDLDDVRRFIEWCEDNNYVNTERYNKAVQFLEKCEEQLHQLTKSMYNIIYLKNKLY